VQHVNLCFRQEALIGLALVLGSSSLLHAAAFSTHYCSFLAVHSNRTENENDKNVYSNVKYPKLITDVMKTFVITLHLAQLSQYYRSNKFGSDKRTRLRNAMVLCADPSGHAVKGVGLRPLACWDCGCESSREHGRLSLASVVCCQVEVCATG
jgi:hypothetical protein